MEICIGGIFSKVLKGFRRQEPAGSGAAWTGFVSCGTQIIQTVSLEFHRACAKAKRAVCGSSKGFAVHCQVAERSNKSCSQKKVPGRRT